MVLWMKILITGASSLPGFRTMLEALDKGDEVVGTYLNNQIPFEHDKLRKLKLDVRDPTRLKDMVLVENPDALVYMAALGDVDVCERDKRLAWETNIKPIVLLAPSLTKNSPFLLHLSTDYVFDGETGNYSEDDPPNPVDYYGFTKLAGELVFASLGNCAIVRASSIYGFGPGRKNFAKFLVEKLEKGEPIRALVDQFTSPSQATLLAKAILEIIERRLVGTFHIVGERISRYEFATKVAKALDLDESLIEKAKMEDMKWFAKRPKDSSLDSAMAREKLDLDFHSTGKALQMLREEYLKRHVDKKKGLR